MKTSFRINVIITSLMCGSVFLLANGCSPDGTPVALAIAAKQKLPGTTPETSIAIANRDNEVSTENLPASPTDDCENPVSCERNLNGNIAYCADDGKTLTFCDTNVTLTADQTGWFVINCAKAKTQNQLACAVSTNQTTCQANTAGCTWNAETSKCDGTVTLNGLCTTNSSGENPTVDCT